MSDGGSGPIRPSGPPLGGDREVQFQRHRGWWQLHRTAVIAVVVVLVVIGGITAAVLATRDAGDVSVADPSTVSSAPAPSPSPTVHPTTSAPAPPPVSTAKGTVVAVVAVGRWTMAVEKGLQVTVVATPSTTYPKNKDATDVKKGSVLTVTGTFAGGIITAKTVAIAKKAT